MSDSPQRCTLWWQAKGEERAELVKATVDRLEREQQSRRSRALANISLYEGRQLASLSAKSYFDAGEYNPGDVDYDRMRVNMARAMVSTALAKVAGKQRPKSQFCVAEADWTTKRKAKKLERFVEAQLLSRQDGLTDGYAVGILAFRDACVCDMGVLGFSADEQAGRVTIQRVLPWEIVVDPEETRSGLPLNLFRVYSYDRYKLAARFPDFEEEILSAPELSRDDPAAYEHVATGRDLSRLVKVREAWRLPLGEDKPGAHAIVVGSVDLCGGDEEWTRPFFPFEFIVWEQQMLGMLGTSLVDIVRPLCDELNASYERWAVSEKLNGSVYLPFEEGAVNKEDLESNIPWALIPVQPGHPVPVPIVPETQGQASQAWMSLQKALIYETSGVGQQGATGTQKGANMSAAAVTTINNIETERFSIQWQAFERVMGIGAARQILACVREMADNDNGKAIVSRFAAGGILREIEWNDVNFDLPDDAIQLYAVSGLVNTPADRLDLGERLFNAGVIGAEAYLAIIQYKDLDSALSRARRQTELIDKYIEEWLDADESYQYHDPIALNWMNCEEAIVQVGRAAMDAELDAAPDHVLKLFVTFLGNADKEVQRRAEQAAQLQAIAAGKAAGAAPMGAPQLPPMQAPPPGVAA